eukprot:COSAG01_NODE_533_length_15816_cov_4.518738_12_plen_123_part_00
MLLPGGFWSDLVIVIDCNKIIMENGGPRCWATIHRLLLLMARLHRNNCPPAGAQLDAAPVEDDCFCCFHCTKSASSSCISWLPCGGSSLWAVACATRLLIEARWGPTLLAFAAELRPRRLIK